MAEASEGPLVPPDILESIIDAAAIVRPYSGHQPLSVLKSFALVCHATLPMCRKHLFASVIINDPFALGRTTNSFYQFLTQSPDLAPYIRRLVFYLVSFSIQTQPAKTSRKLTRLQSLELCTSDPGYVMPWTHHRRVVLPLLHLPTITQLKLYSIKNFLVSDLILCVSLKDLQIRRCSINGGDVQPASASSNSIALEKFTCTWDEAIDPIYRAQYADGKPIIDFLNLKEISMAAAHRLDLHSLEDLFGNCHQLVDVHISFFHPSSKLEGLFNIVQASLETLKYLRVEFPVNDKPKRLLDPFAGLCPELEKMSGCNALETLKLDIHLSTNYNSAQRAGWGALEKTLIVSSGFAALRQVSLVFAVAQSSRSRSLGDTLKPALLRHFQRLASRPMVDLQMQLEVCDD